MNGCLSYQQQGGSSLTVRGAFLAAWQPHQAKYLPAAWQHDCGAGKLYGCHQPFLAPCRARLGLIEHQ